MVDFIEQMAFSLIKQKQLLNLSCQKSSSVTVFYRHSPVICKTEILSIFFCFPQFYFATERGKNQKLNQTLKYQQQKDRGKMNSGKPKSISMLQVLVPSFSL